MEIKQGATRIVILTKDYAIKVGKIKVLHFLERMMAFIFSHKERKTLMERHGKALLRGVKNGIFPGQAANLNEYRYYMASKDPRVMPVLRKMLWGLVIIQPRGIPINAAELAASHLFQPVENDTRDLYTRDLSRPEQFCRRAENLEIVVVDFGMEGTVEFLQATMFV